jgi:hypothetical protein
VELLVVSEHDDLALELRLGTLIEHVIDLPEQLTPFSLPAFMDDHRAEIGMHLIAGLDEVVDRSDPFRDREVGTASTLATEPRLEGEPGSEVDLGRS